MRETLTNGLIICCIVVLIVGGLAFTTMGPEIKAATNAGCTQRGWKPVFEEPAADEIYTWNHSFSIEDMDMPTTTGITTGLVIQCTMRMQCTGNSVGQHMRFTPFTAAGLNYIDLQYGYSSGDEYHYYLDELPDTGQQNGTSFTVAVGDWIVVPITTTITNLNFTSEHATNPIGEKGTTHAKECSLSESWAVTDQTQVVVEVEGLDTMTYNWPAGQPINIGTVLCDFTLISTTDDWTIDATHCQFTDISVGMIDIDTSQLAETWGGSEHLHARGGGNDISFWKDADIGSTSRNCSYWINMPRAYSFAGLDVIDRDGNSYQDALVWNTGVREWDSEGDPICPVCKTVAQWQAFDEVQARGCYSWDTGDPDLNASVTLYIDRDWARSAGLDGFTGAESSTKSFAHDARIIIDGWTIDKTSRDCSPYNSSVLSIAHKTSQGIYAFDQDHTNWDHDANCNSPNEDGEFTTTAANAQQLFALVNNREARLGGLVQIQEAAAGVPDAYITYRHDQYYSTYPFPELTRESVYCWKGWRYLYLQLLPPTSSGNETTVSLTIEYYDTETHSDPHVSDSTRQTDYSYTLGAMKTKTIAMMIPQEGLATNCCFDLGELQPMLIVKRLTLIVEAVGAWEIGEPTLALDAGDTLEERAAVSPHSYIKEFGAYPYARGGVSAVVDGVSAGSMEWPDGSHENMLEHTGGHFDHVVGATSGIDLTNAASLATYAGWMQKCSDAWNASVDSDAEEAATSDGTNTLKTLSAFDMRPVHHLCSDSLGADVAIRVGTFTAAPGIHYTFCSEKITGGQMHGLSSARNGNNGQLWRRLADADPEDDWDLLQDDITSDGHGYWQSENLTIWNYEDDEEGEPVGTLWNFSTDEGAHSTGRMATREWYAIALTANECVGVCMAADPAGTAWIGIDDQDVIRIYTMASPIQQPVRRTDAFTSTRHSHPCILPMPDGSILLFATLEGSTQTDILSSRDYGVTWQPVEAEEDQTLIGDDLKCVSAVHTWGIILAAGVADGTAYFEKGGKEGTDKGTFPEEATRVEIALSDDVRPALLILPCSAILATLTYGGVAKIYRSDDLGETWALVEATI